MEALVILGVKDKLYFVNINTTLQTPYIPGNTRVEFTSTSKNVRKLNSNTANKII